MLMVELNYFKSIFFNFHESLVLFQKIFLRGRLREVLHARFLTDSINEIYSSQILNKYFISSRWCISQRVSFIKLVISGFRFYYYSQFNFVDMIMIYIKFISVQQKLFLIPRNLLILEIFFSIMNFFFSDLYFPKKFC